MGCLRGPESLNGLLCDLERVDAVGVGDFCEHAAHGRQVAAFVRGDRDERHAFFGNHAEFERVPCPFGKGGEEFTLHAAIAFAEGVDGIEPREGLGRLARESFAIKAAKKVAGFEIRHEALQAFVDLIADREILAADLVHGWHDGLSAILEGEGLMAQMPGPLEHVLEKVLVDGLKIGGVESRFRAETTSQFEQPDGEYRMLGRF
ncbi:hypothetical protein [Sinorhizobium sp. CCBAU 05631]|uniref:hypothetical protein n=1 Tax=Sinorhizobium sp. CCBAU 05631 TaxID=794846 RepID=UPI001FCACAB4|nr:hypothetical protein [Sinorhizobium sp. CCBAU 05631]